MHNDNPPVVVVMGVSGSGKTTLGKLIAARLGAQFLEADDYHAPESIAKMSAGIPLTDDDRWPWLDRLGAAALAQHGPVVMACSALRKAYRDRLRDGLGRVIFVEPHGDPEIIRARMRARTDHYMPASLLDSQIDALESPVGEPLSWRVPIDDAPDAIVDTLFANPEFRAAVGAAGNASIASPPAMGENR